MRFRGRSSSQQLLFNPQVASHVELREENDHRRHVTDENPVHPHGLLAAAPTRHAHLEHALDQVSHVDHGDQHELDKLQLRQNGSPPALHAQHRTQIVCVHEHVDERVQQHGKTVVASGIHVEEEVGHYRDAAVVVHVQEGHLAVRLAQNEQEGVDELPVLLDVEDVDELRWRRGDKRTCAIRFAFSEAKSTLLQ